MLQIPQKPNHPINKNLTQERFSQIIDDPDLLRRITYEELKTLTLAYPYAHNLRCLLALKAQQIDHTEASQNLATAATYSLDRTRLFMLTAPQVIAPQQLLAPEEVLELKPIKTLKRELEALSPVAREEKTFESAKAMESIPPTEPTSVPVYEARFEIVQPPAEPLEVVSAHPVPVIRQEFSDWISNFHPPILEPSIRPAPPAGPVPIQQQKDEESTKSNGFAQKLAERSVAENQDVISETLAKLYAKQGYRDKSAQMYARLALLFPEKSAYFAAEIDKLKK